MGVAPDVELNVCVHVSTPQSVRISDTGDDKDGKWIPRSLLGSFHLTGKQSRGTDRKGQHCMLPIACLTLPEWKAKQEGLI